MSWYRYESDVLILKLYIQPGAKRDEVMGPMKDELKIKLATPALEGRANSALIKFLSQLCQVPKSKIVLKSGEKSRHKIIEISTNSMNMSLLFEHNNKETNRS